MGWPTLYKNVPAFALRMERRSQVDALLKRHKEKTNVPVARYERWIYRARPGQPACMASYSKQKDKQKNQLQAAWTKNPSLA